MKLKTILIIAILTLLIGGLSASVYYQKAYEYYLVTPVDKESNARITLNVDGGDTGKTIAKKLTDLDLINSDWAFYKYIKEENLGAQIEAGKFILKKSYTIPEIAQYLTNAKKDEVVVTVREGLSLQQVDDYLAKNNVLPAGSFLDCARKCVPDEHYSFLDSKPAGQSLEGYLFPDTYFVDPETITAQGLISRMLKNFDEKLDSTLRSEIAKSGHSIHQIITMASLIEKESRTADEKPIIAGILWKRLAQGGPLGVDASVRYAVNKWTEPLTIDDLQVNSPYNTRKKAGLPPGPIGNFSVESLKAAIMPTESDYYYYLHGSDGIIHYAKTNEEHVANKQKYLQ